MIFGGAPDRSKDVLLVNRSDSRCSACNGDPAPESVLHRLKRGVLGEGCGALLVALSSDYVGMDESVKAHGLTSRGLTPRKVHTFTARL